MEEQDRIRSERDLYRHLLELGQERELQPSLERALKLAVEVTGARQAYLQIGEDGDGEPRWAIARAEDETDVNVIRTRLSSTIIRQALASGVVRNIPSAICDPDLNSDSVFKKKIESVVCVPLGTPPVGVLYLQRPVGTTQGFPPEHVELAKTFAAQVAPILHRLDQEERAKRANDPTKPWREKLKLEGIVGRSQALARLFQQVANFARTDIGLLITGNSGTGKTAIAAAIHANSPRQARRFVVLNCGTVQHELARSELFGHKKGAFTGAVSDKPGKVEAANGGTLFLDDVDLLSTEVQGLLLDFLQSHEYSMVGDTVVKRADVRVLFATNRRLEQEMSAGRFRKDLYYRIAEAQVHLPSLTQRREDIPLLASHFVAEFAEENRTAPIPLSPIALSVLETADLPGEVRELRSLVRGGFLRALGEDVGQIEVRHIYHDDRVATEIEDPAQMTYHQATRWFQGRFLKQTLQAVNGDLDAAKDRLDLGWSRLYQLLRIHGLERK